MLTPIKPIVIAEANAGVAEFNALYAEYRQNPEIVKERYYIEAMTQFLKNNQIVISSSEDQNIHKFYNFSENAAKNDVILGGNK